MERVYLIYCQYIDPAVEIRCLWIWQIWWKKFSTLAVVGALQKYHNMTFEEEAKSIVA